ncbi:MAG: hypothetical protein AAB426_04460, partial [Myxococcota bacterium]
TVADLQRDGRPEIIVVSGEGVAATDAAGQVLPGFPAILRNLQDAQQLMLEAAPTVCDLDGDGTSEIAVAGSDRRLYAVTASGRMAPGYPVPLDGVVRGPLACMPQASGRRRDLVAVTDAGSLTVAPGEGGSAKRIARLGKGAESGVAVADLDGDGNLEIIAVGGDAGVYVVDRTGRARRGFPYKMTYRAAGVPAIGDIDDDGVLDIVVGSQDFKVHAIDAGGKSLAGFPLATAYRIYGGVSLVDLTDDGVLDGAVGSADGKLYAFDGHGKTLDGFPVDLGGRLVSDIAAGDVDRDGLPELALVTQGGALALLDAHGRPVKPFPLQLGGKWGISPALADLNGDGLPALIAQATDGMLHAYRFEARGEATEAIVAWPMVGHDAAHSGRYAPNPARFKEVAFSLKRVRTTDALRVSYRFVDLDGDAERDTQIRWFVDGQPVVELNNAREVPAARTRKHQRWEYTLQEGASFRAYSEKGRLARLFRSAPIEIENTPATAPAISLTPATPTTVEPLQVTVTGASSDADGDVVQYRMLWLRNGSPVDAWLGKSSVDAKATRKHEEWRVVVVPFDGEEEGESASAVVTVLNTPPFAPEIAVEPAPVRVTGPAQVVIRKPARDADNDTASYTYNYRINGVALSVPAAMAQLPASALRKHQRVDLAVTAHDDEVAGGIAKLTFEVANSAPQSPTIAIWPTEPTTSVPLRLAVTKPALDADGDVITLRHRWLRDGLAVEFPPEVPSSATHKGERWQLEVTPFDGEESGPTARAETRIRNTAPTAPAVILDRYQFAADEPVEPRVVTAATDADGDPLRLKYVWKRNDAPMRFTDSKATLVPQDTHKGERWELVVRANDGEVDSPPMALRFLIVNSPPSAPEVQLTTTTPTVIDTVTVRISKAATDKDGDKLTHRYRWFRDDTAMFAPTTSKSALVGTDTRKGEHWRVEVVAFDGESEGPAGIAELWVQNAAPSAPELSIEPAAPTATDDLSCRRAHPGADPDRDPLTYRTRWYRDGTLVDLAADAETLAATLTHKGETWTCDMMAYDGEKTSSVARSPAVRIVNSAPTMPKVVLEPTEPTTESELDCRLREISADADGDALSYSYEWRVDGKPWTAPRGSEPSHVPAGSIRRGQRWQCRVTPQDGSATGGAAEASIVVQNSKPTAPRVQVTPLRPTAGSPLTCEIVESSRDADGNAISYRYTWLRDGVEQPFAASSTQVPSRLVRARDLWRCRVVPADDADDGTAGESRDVAVAVSPPSG